MCHKFHKAEIYNLKSVIISWVNLIKSRQRVINFEFLPQIKLNLVSSIADLISILVKFLDILKKVFFSVCFNDRL
ncbi:hypothetical protein C7H19_01290 [Aphanothece hegewaldii CCALA 016]|uniref:Uncharacterized protein n=1 Tax=Aphanothece hegewaldii CCALA 016 TaxID=2107694 RepID=A0A2T1M3N2_9CHRO|nr:hypothetical protein C7H19_01290 [Aphanothece hegewaldii CCALA 016]